MATRTTASPAAFSSAIAFSDLTCDIPELLTRTEPLRKGGWLHFHGALLIVSCIAGGFAILTLMFISMSHLLNFVRPQEQKQLIRVISCIGLYVICSIASVGAYNASGYLEPIPAFWEAFAIASLFFFYTSALTAKSGVVNQYHTRLDRKRKNNFNRTEKSDIKDMRWFHWHWILVFQLLAGRFGSLITYEYLEAHLCPYSQELRRKTTILRIVELVQLIIAVVTVIHFLFAMRRSFQPHHREHAKLWTFKVSIIVIAFQQFIFQTLSTRFVWKPTARVSFRDLQIGVPNMLVCCEMFIASLVMLWSFSSTEYSRLANHTQVEKMGFLRAILEVINITDLFVGAFFGLVALLPDRILPKRFSSRANLDRDDEHTHGTSEDSLMKERAQVENQPVTWS